MQHTNKYKFNIIEADDPFSPDALNENTQKVEDALVTHEAVVDSVLKDQKLAWQAADKTEAAAREAADKTEAATREAADKTEAAAREAADRAETAAREAALSALTARVGALEQGRLLFKYGTYKGTGSSTARLDFDFKPLLVVVSDQKSYSRGGCPWVNGVAQGYAASGNAVGAAVKLTWEDRGVKWSQYVGSSADDWLNDSSITYCYFALGVAE